MCWFGVERENRNLKTNLPIAAKILLFRLIDRSHGMEAKTGRGCGKFKNISSLHCGG